MILSFVVFRIKEWFVVHSHIFIILIGKSRKLTRKLSTLMKENDRSQIGLKIALSLLFKDNIPYIITISIESRICYIFLNLRLRHTVWWWLFFILNRENNCTNANIFITLSRFYECNMNYIGLYNYNVRLIRQDIEEVVRILINLSFCRTSWL